MEGSMRYYPGLVASTGDIHPEQLKLPLLFFTANDMNYIEDLDAYHGPPNERIGRSVLNEWTHGDVTTVNMWACPILNSVPCFSACRTPIHSRETRSQITDGKTRIQVIRGLHFTCFSF